MGKFDEIRATAASVIAGEATGRYYSNEQLLDLLMELQAAHDADTEEAHDEHVRELASQQQAHLKEQAVAVNDAILKTTRTKDKEHDEDIADRQRELKNEQHENGRLREKIEQLREKVERRSFVRSSDGRRIIERAFNADPVQTQIELNYMGYGSLSGELGVEKGLRDQKQLTLAAVG